MEDSNQSRESLYGEEPCLVEIRLSVKPSYCSNREASKAGNGRYQQYRAMLDRRLRTPN